jgi:hypothetical protein
MIINAGHIHPDALSDVDLCYVHTFLQLWGWLRPYWCGTPHERG